MADRIAENADQIVDDMKRKARRRLVGAVVLALAAAIILPMLLEKEPRPLGDDVSVKIPPVDESKFINKLTGKSGDTKALPKADERSDAKRAGAKPEATPDSAASVPITTSPTVAPAASASSADTTAPKKSVTDAEQRALSPMAKTATKSDSGGVVASSSTPKPPASAAPESKVEAKPAIVDAKSADAKSGAGVPSPMASASSPPAAQPATSVAAAAPSEDSSTSAPASAVATAAKPEGFVVQLAAFADDKGANSLANKLKKVGYSAFVEPVQTSRGTLWRVRVGGYGTRPEADAARTKLKGEGYNGIVAPAT